DEILRYDAVDALGGIGPASRSAILAIIKTTHDSDPDVRRHACSALGHIASATPEVVQALTAALADPEEGGREEAAAALGWLGPGAKTGLAALEKAGKQEGIVRLASAYAVARIDPSHAAGLPVLRAALKDANWQMCSTAIRDLASLGPPAKDAAPALVE